MEVNFDGIPGPTHNYSGLATGNLASERNASAISNPREAALQGLSKMRALAARGLPQAVLPPHERPAMHALRALGFAGVVMWSRWAWDWKPQPAGPVIQRLRRVRGGDIVLLHDGDYRRLEGDRRHTVAAMEYWLPRWRDRGMRFVTMDDWKRNS